ncbi:type II toxin-antitoxin system mRNA interferase toxin, RelE/StbE family [Sulfurimonas lithotrophica]|uniref:Type II toxin-antitoxin system mRNA interferase toxin, RelE/StbE family n=2 Tax=Sulfurimonas lithotrophica TaxID=2590022 RepID=A0A5P8P1H5_9BACT|nr:type II toxin-antitoxin system mRNA interferase toxin, RelE/StbE family [Sulfurimonas lithotrophica]QFR49583.1 type II toxin-antitoxin system mRNA interferase toxin, RelE/StbE family [Sulfurimonas lithotrophica]
MTYKLIFTEQYEKRLRKFIKKHPEVLSQYEKTIKLLEVNPHHPSLRLHKLSGKLSDLHSVSINISYRITLELIFTKKEIIPVEIGSHDEVY